MRQTEKVWLVTGSGNGLGRNIVESALQAGHKVIATARNITQLEDLANQYGQQIRIAVLDVTNEKQAKEVVQSAIEYFGRIDVLVNNAGYGDKRPFEQTPADEFRQLVETCFFGVVTLCREVLPTMRKQRSGHIIQISSIGGRFATPGNAAYHAAKWAIGGFTESLALETAPFQVNITALEPGGMRTSWGQRAFSGTLDLLPDYEPSVGAQYKAVEGYWGHESGDPEKVAQLVLKIAEAKQLPAHILLGSDVYQFARAISEQQWKVADRWKEVSAYIDFTNQQPLPELPGV
ncbi:SDR family NAD(P)-dependent oxidoreductase [Spirosoma sp. HMF4905]|uniref:SDR family NAD(P)-dependent oxidoreductase n=1 Tax=Spirosoma arboris TaxID=2682092 RepID=A0A7K1SB30_9BACT|nr:SDR family NAD(P)-dependent oxidoreductase [Spirosoma arboris]MVM30965.1 SDR family NAD(P)-dependent oxidoreductase [Spirosoma arboris]